MIEIVYEDNHLLAVNKPAGMLTQATKENSDCLEMQVKAWIKEKYKKPGNVFLGAVHRLDRPVSGIVLFAKTSKALSRLNALIRNQEIHKTYFAIVEGSPKEDCGTLEHFLRHDEHRAHVGNKGEPEVKLARLHYKILKHIGNNALLQIELETGRYHQIRAQCAAIGCPIVGDKKYGSRQQLPGEIIALHHGRLELEHPITHVHLCIEVPMVAKMTTLHPQPE